MLNTVNKNVNIILLLLTIGVLILCILSFLNKCKSKFADGYIKNDKIEYGTSDSKYCRVLKQTHCDKSIFNDQLCPKNKTCQASGGSNTYGECVNVDDENKEVIC